MAFETKIFQMAVGTNYVYSRLLLLTRVHMVSRQGVVFRPGTGTPGNREFVYDVNAGTVTFLNPCEDVYSEGRFIGEPIQITYEV